MHGWRFSAGLSTLSLIFTSALDPTFLGPPLVSAVVDNSLLFILTGSLVEPSIPRICTLTSFHSLVASFLNNPGKPGIGSSLRRPHSSVVLLLVDFASRQFVHERSGLPPPSLAPPLPPLLHSLNFPNCSLCKRPLLSLPFFAPLTSLPSRFSLSPPPALFLPSLSPLSPWNRKDFLTFMALLRPSPRLALPKLCLGSSLPALLSLNNFSNSNGPIHNPPIAHWHSSRALVDVSMATSPPSSPFRRALPSILGTPRPISPTLSSNLTVELTESSNWEAPGSSYGGTPMALWNLLTPSVFLSTPVRMQHMLKQVVPHTLFY